MSEFQLYLAEDALGTNERMIDSVGASRSSYEITNAPRHCSDLTATAAAAHCLPLCPDVQRVLLPQSAFSLFMPPTRTAGLHRARSQAVLRIQTSSLKDVETHVRVWLLRRLSGLVGDAWHGFATRANKG